MLQLKNVSMAHLKDLTDLVLDLTVSINAGDKVALIGEEGNGKSSLLKLMMDESLIADYISFRGQIQRQFSSFSYLPQQLAREDEGLSLNDYIFGQGDRDLNYAALYRYAAELGFDSERFATDQVLASLSGGETLKVQLIRKLSEESDILFLDEPSNDLDLDTLTWLEGFLQKTRKTVVFVSHDQALLSQTASKIIHLERLKKRQLARTSVQNLGYDDYAKEREESYTKQLQQAKKEREEHQKKLDRHHRIHQSVEHTLRNTHDATMGRLIAKKMKNILSQEKRYQKEAENLTEIPLREARIDLRFQGIENIPAHKRVIDLQEFYLEVAGKVLARHLQLTVKAGEKVGLIGPNGAGKSSLLKQIYHILNSTSPYTIGYMPQDYRDVLDEKMTPLAFLAEGGDKKKKEQVLTHLASLQFTREEARHPISHLSGGQKAKLLLLKMVLDSPPILLLDEPTRNFSPTSQPEVRKLFADFPGSLVTVSHDRLFLKEVCHKIYRLSETGLEEVEIKSL